MTTYHSKFAKFFVTVLLISIFTIGEVLVAQEQVGELTSQESSPVNLLEIRIEPGDTLSKFAERYLDDPQEWPQILKYNEIPSGDPNLIIPGDILRVPEDLVKDEIADIIHMRNDVRMRRQEATTWDEATLYQRLYPEDGIRTSANSGAKIEYLRGGVADIGANSLVFLKPDETREDIVEIEVGELYAEDIKVLTETASIDPATGSEYKAVVDEDRTTTLSVYKGEVDFISAGEMRTIEEGFMSVAEFDQAPSEPIILPDPPEIEGQQFEEGESFPDMQSVSTLDIDSILSRVGSGKDGVPEDRVNKLHIQVASDKNFSRIIVDRKVDTVSPEEIKEELMDGEYWWRAAFVNQAGVTGKFSEPVPMIVDTRPPSLKITNPAHGAELAQNILSLRGETDSYSEIFVNEERITVDNEGNFVTAVRIKIGENTINVKSKDTAGRVTEKDLTVVGVHPDRETQQQDILVTVGIVASVLSVGAIVLTILR